MASRQEILDDDNVNLIDEALQVIVANGVQKTITDLETLISTMRASGASDEAIRQELMQDLDNGGRIFGAFKNQFKATADFAIGRMATYGIKREYDRKGVDVVKWQSVGKNICPDCASRHGRVASWEEWELAGLPQSGFSVCGLHCNCDLVPETEWIESPLKVPIETETQARG